MSVISLVILLLGLSAVLWLVNSKVSSSINPTMRTLINIVIITLGIILVLGAFGIWEELRNIQVPKL